MKDALAVVGIPVWALLCAAVWRFVRKRTPWQLVQLLGATCLAVVVLTHVAEAFHLAPGMGWGLPDSVGHYIDLSSAMLGLILVPLGFLAEAAVRLGRHCADPYRGSNLKV